MFDSIFEIMIVLIPLAIFIGRVVVQARGKRKSPVKQRPIPVHFEDYDDEDERQFAPTAAPPSVQNQKDSGGAYSLPISMESALKPPPPKKAKTPSAEPAHGFLNLNHLSPMKQAVVLAEILGPPKGSE